LLFKVRVELSTVDDRLAARCERRRAAGIYPDCAFGSSAMDVVMLNEESANHRDAMEPPPRNALYKHGFLRVGRKTCVTPDEQFRDGW
jgi:hypothetical protein